MFATYTTLYTYNKKNARFCTHNGVRFAWWLRNIASRKGKQCKQKAQQKAI